MSRRLPLSNSINFLSIYALEKEPGEEVSKNLKAFLDIYYADDLTYATTEKTHREKIKIEVPRKLEKYNLHVNHTKTEEGEAPDRSPPPAATPSTPRGSSG